MSTWKITYESPSNAGPAHMQHVLDAACHAARKAGANPDNLLVVYDGDVAYLGSLEAQEAAYWEARRQGMGLSDKQIGDLLRVAAPHIKKERP